MRFLHDSAWGTRHRGWCVLGLPALLLLAGCGGGGGGSSSPTPTPTPTPTPAPSLTVTTATGLTASLAENSSTVAVGGSIVYMLKLTNSTSVAIPVHSTAVPPTAPAAGLIIRNAAGSITFAPVPGAPPVFNGSLAAGQSISSQVTATGFAAAGVYKATASFSDDTSAAATVGPLTVTAQ